MSAPPGGARRFAAAPPLTLYVHLPWCVAKCPYCDFNSHAARGAIPETAYVDALLLDLDGQLRAAPASLPALHAVFIGGGTPSLFSGSAVARLLCGIRQRCRLAADAEITLEANPGTLDAGHFEGYLAAGVNRLSIGVQSLSERHLRTLGRIHDPDQALATYRCARRLGCGNINLDLMYGLPGQTAAQAEEDLARVIDLGPEHISYYQLTLEPNTAFAHQPPRLPGHDRLWEIEQQGHALLAAAGYGRYEISAFARAGKRCRHNLNYWRFGDYLGIGAGAHGKLTDWRTGRVVRSAAPRHPDAYRHAPDRHREPVALDDADLTLEFMLNALRLVDGVPAALFTRHTGLALERISAVIARCRADGLLAETPERLAPSALGLRFLNTLIARFEPG